MHHNENALHETRIIVLTTKITMLLQGSRQKRSSESAVCLESQSFVVHLNRLVQSTGHVMREP